MNLSLIIKHLVAGQVCFIGFLGVSMLLRPDGLTRSLSFYGTCSETGALYVMGLLIFSFLLFEASELLPREKPYLTISRVLRIISALLFCSAITPHTIHPIVGAIHLVTSSLAFDFMLGLSIWLTLRLVRDTTNWCLVFIQLAGGIVAMACLIWPFPFMLAGELLFELVFVILLARTICTLQRNNAPRPLATA